MIPSCPQLVKQFSRAQELPLDVGKNFSRREDVTINYSTNNLMDLAVDGIVIRRRKACRGSFESIRGDRPEGTARSLEGGGLKRSTESAQLTHWRSGK